MQQRAAMAGDYQRPMTMVATKTSTLIASGDAVIGADDDAGPTAL